MSPPGVGLGALLSGARRISDDMFLIAAQRLAELADGGVDLLPPVTSLSVVTAQIAAAVTRQAAREQPSSPSLDAEEVEQHMWRPTYHADAGPLRPL